VKHRPVDKSGRLITEDQLVHNFVIFIIIIIQFFQEVATEVIPLCSVRWSQLSVCEALARQVFSVCRVLD
jgi:hypothetical protein